jgi:hypothetical protein
MVCGTHLFVLSNGVQAGLEPEVAVEMVGSGSSSDDKWFQIFSV